MPSLFVPFFLVLFSVSLNAQTASEAAPVVAAVKMNVLYIGVDNPVSIAVPGVPSEKISAELSKNGTLTLVSPGKYTARVTSVDLKGETEVLVYTTQDGEKKLVAKIPFRVKKFPDIGPAVGGKRGGEIEAAFFKLQKGIMLDFGNCDYDVQAFAFRIVGFEMTYESSGRELVTLSTEGSLFTKEMLQIIGTCKAGDHFYFDEIKVLSPDSIMRRLPSMVFKLI